MSDSARRWRILAGSVAAATAGVLGIAANPAAAEPMYPLPPQPVQANAAPAVPLSPGVAQGYGQPALAPAVAQSAATSGMPSATNPGYIAAAAAPQTPVPATTGTLDDYFAEKGVKLEPQVAKDFKALNIVLPVPPGWQTIPDPNVPDAFAVIADRVGGDGIYTSNAALVVYKLVGGNFDPKEAITHGYLDSQGQAAWRTTNASLADFGGMPSAMIEGTYRDNNMTLNTSRRHTIATVGADKYLVSLSVTTTAAEAIAAADATDAITNGFQIRVPGTPAPASPQVALAAPAR
jgi:probable lipoprotein LpqN